MQEYKIEIKEILSRIVTMEAESVENAIRNVQEQYDSQNIVLNYNDFCGYDILPCENR